VLFRTAPGQFEVSAPDAAVARDVVAAAAAAWQALAAPLGLPGGFAAPVFVRMIPAAEWRDAAAFRVIVEPGGIVSARVPFSEGGVVGGDRVLRRALVQALLLRVAVAREGVSPRLTCPLWLELAAVSGWETRTEPARLDRLKYESRTLVAPRLAELLTWPRGAAEPAALEAGAAWLLTFLQMESTRANEWPAFLARVLAGTEPLGALAACFPGRFSSEAERELWWSTGLQHLRRLRALPVLNAEESRAELEALMRFVVTDPASEARDELVPLARVLEHAREPFVAAELQRRRGELRALLPALHPFFRNAGLSLADVLAAAAAAPAKRAEALGALERDWADAQELAAATRAALDRLERSRAAAH
jgi:hypothetical protein